MFFGLAITQEQFTAWSAAIATSIGTIGAVLEVVGRRLIRMYVEEHGKLNASERQAYLDLQSQTEAIRQEVITWRTLAQEKLAAVDKLTKINAQTPEDLSGRVLELINELRVLHAELPVPGLCFRPPDENYAPNTSVTYATQDVSPTRAFSPKVERQEP